MSDPFNYSPGTSKRYLAKAINYECGKRCFCSVHVLRSGLRVWLHLKYSQIQSPPTFARDVANVGHWGTGDVELRITNGAELEEATDLIRRSFESARQAAFSANHIPNSTIESLCPRRWRGIIR